MNVDRSGCARQLGSFLCGAAAMLLALAFFSGAPERSITSPQGAPAQQQTGVQPGKSAPVVVPGAENRSAKRQHPPPLKRQTPGATRVAVGDLSINMQRSAREAVLMLVRIARTKGAAAALEYVRSRLKHVGPIDNLLDSFSQEMMLRGIPVLLEFDQSLREPIVELLVDLLRKTKVREELRLQALGALFGLGTDDIGIWQFAEPGSKPWYMINLDWQPRNAQKVTFYHNGRYPEPLAMSVGFTRDSRFWEETGAVINQLLAQTAEEKVRAAALMGLRHMTQDRLDPTWLAQFYRELPDRYEAANVKYAVIDAIVATKVKTEQRGPILLELLAEDRDGAYSGPLLELLPRVTSFSGEVQSQVRQGLASDDKEVYTGAVRALALYAQAGDERATAALSSALSGMLSADERKWDIAKHALRQIRELKLRQFTETARRLREQMKPGTRRDVVDMLLLK